MARLGLLLFGLLLSGLVSEVLLRVFGPDPTLRAKPVDSDAAGLPELHSMFDILKPNLHAQLKGRLYESNSFGFRGPEIPEKKPPGVFRIALVGDSFTNGQGVRYEEAYPTLLAGILNKPGETRRYEVLNLGIGGFNLESSVRRLDTGGWQFAPDLVVYGYTINDVEGESYRLSHDRGRTRWRTPSRIVNLLDDKYEYLRDVFWPGEGSYVWELDDNYFRNPDAWGQWKGDLANLKRTTEKHNVCVAMLIHTELRALNLWHPYERYYDVVEAEAKKQHYFVIDSFPYFKGRRAEKLWVDDFNFHPNPEGHQILAQALIDGLKELPPVCWRGQVPLALQPATSSEKTAD